MVHTDWNNIACVRTAEHSRMSGSSYFGGRVHPCVGASPGHNLHFLAGVGIQKGVCDYIFGKTVVVVHDFVIVFVINNLKEKTIEVIKCLKWEWQNHILDKDTVSVLQIFFNLRKQEYCARRVQVSDQ